MSIPTLPSADPGTQLLDGLDALVRRHRALRGGGDPGNDALHAELITAEVAQQLAAARTALRRRPRVA
ncbi:hypothetical protein WHI96_09400 [Pseudonocardia tropica]|uniref:Uncharacterized protein n=1 Tax=Pseudonocardia tropica TaxID=681289 RepID=A0ABV1JSV4_9PSEU